MESLPRFEKVVLEGVMSKKQQAQYSKLVAVVEAKGGEAKVNAGVYINNKSCFVLTCNKGDNWVASYTDIVDKGNGCSVCKPAKLSIERIQQIIDAAVTEGIPHCVCKELISVRTKGGTKCRAMLECSQCKSEWSAFLCDIIYDQTRCPNCANITKTLSDARKLAHKLKGWCCAKIYVNAHTKMPFTCRKLHKFMATYGNVQQGRWCPKCRESKAERAMNEYLTKLGIGFEPQQKFDTLRGTRNGLLRYDFYLLSYHSIVEMNGIQHEMSIKIFGGEPRFIRRLKDDETKYLWCVENKKSLLCIRHTTFKAEKMQEVFDTFLERVKKGEHVVIDEFREERLLKLREYAEMGM